MFFEHVAGTKNLAVCHNRVQNDFFFPGANDPYDMVYGVIFTWVHGKPELAGYNSPYRNPRNERGAGVLNTMRDKAQRLELGGGGSLKSKYVVCVQKIHKVISLTFMENQDPHVPGAVVGLYSFWETGR